MGAALPVRAQAWRAAAFGNRTFGVPLDIDHSSIGQRQRLACRYSAESGETATGLPTARRSGRYEYESAYANECRRSTPSWRA